MKLFSEVEIGETFVVAGGHTLVKVSAECAEFPDAPNVGWIEHPADTVTFTTSESRAFPAGLEEDIF